jgi:lysophospholipase L1-like esterase
MPLPSAGPSRFLALGDSYTIGEGVLVSDRWPVQLVERLRRANRPFDEPQIIAVTGWTTSELLSAIARQRPIGPFDLVSLLIGVNNQYRGRGLGEYGQEFPQLLEESIALAGNRPQNVLVLSIPDWGVTPFAAGRDRAQIATEIDAFNEINREASSRVGVHYVDVTPSSREAAADRSMWTGDGLHPSAKLYTRWAELAWGAIA